MTGVELIRLLENNGFACVKVKGSHYRMSKGNIVIFVPHHHKELGNGLTNSILRKAGLK
ncbi:MAG: type II toxin-antitoxin system HicA family toxin [Oscillospiraceae bacterium]|jgi:predicted RNA binding protein YcfA (HicA-like mRNA interferase family)|nr:type II toxin-antitoxin system HicA family toxin [Oscillospiraceae bacterium]